MHAAVEIPADPAIEADLRLAALVADGDRRAQRMLVVRLAARVQRVCLAIVGNPVDADDAAQGALLEILRAVGGYSGRSRIEPWADRVVARHASRHLARERGRATAPLSHEPPGEESVVSFAEGLPRPLRTYLDALSEANREAVVLRHALGYTVSEIAELTQSPVGTVKDRLVRGRKRLRKLIARDQNIGVEKGGKR